MRSLHGLTLIVALTAAGVVATPDRAVAGAGMAHAHLGHVMTAWKGTPEGKGLLPTAAAEAKIAAQHAGFAAQKLDDLAWMQTHIRHVLNAVDPSLQAKGPGMGYGVLKAASGAAKHIGLAAKSDGASDNVRGHAVHVSASAENTVARVKEISALGGKVLAAARAEDAAPIVQRIVQHAERLLAGRDANGDGKIGWQSGEGGLKVAAAHAGFMAKGEGIN